MLDLSLNPGNINGSPVGSRNSIHVAITTPSEHVTRRSPVSSHTSRHSTADLTPTAVPPPLVGYIGALVLSTLTIHFLNYHSLQGPFLSTSPFLAYHLLLLDPRLPLQQIPTLHLFHVLTLFAPLPLVLLSLLPLKTMHYQKAGS